jgi:hypothetical protein
MIAGGGDGGESGGMKVIKPGVNRQDAEDAKEGRGNRR